MLPSIFVVLAFLVLSTYSYRSETGSQTYVEVITIDDIAKLKLNEGAEFIPLTRDLENRGLISYKIGQRVPNDRLVSRVSDSIYWNVPQNVQLRVEYPSKGIGAVVSFVECNVNQSSENGRAYIISGGYGQRNICFVIEAFSTFWFNYDCTIWGK
ncbi:uncharacterized protein LOC129912309 [Episyrphus balteatus]|uniref:uncharacterized protein LOC129912309 n=1 Tax=Episyrphus balteatus TaxID=286459 RepID=UPI0024863518|nr:uncharacterized protein LOC129912309 [Episyrphus balteatus]